MKNEERLSSEIEMLQSTLERIKYLEQHYLAAVYSYSHTANVSIKEAWQTIEDERFELGLRPRYNTYNSFMNFSAKQAK